MGYVKNRIKVGEKLKSARLNAGLTQEQVAEKVNCESAYISRLENNKAPR